MLGRMRSGALMAAAMMGLSAVAPMLNQPPPVIMRAPAKTSNASRRSIFDMPKGSVGYGRKGAGITMAQQQRSAAKRRNVARNRRNHR